jgi:hypothetical protein
MRGRVTIGLRLAAAVSSHVQQNGTLCLGLRQGGSGCRWKILLRRDLGEKRAVNLAVLTWETMQRWR